MGLKNKYTSPKVELLDKLKIGSETRILKMEVIETSKVKNHYIYECQYVENKNIHQTYIIAVDIEDAIRDKEKAEEFDEEFVELARSVYIVNDQRAAVKKEINLLTKSELIEEKSYSDY